MTRRLLLMRHAKSSWTDAAANDHARPLNKRGRKDAKRVASRLVELAWAPQAVVSSDSQRTRETWSQMEGAFDALDIRFTRALYHAGIDAIHAEVTKVDPGHDTLLLIGHNPGWEEALEVLCGKDERLTTGNVACLTGVGETWEEAVRGWWELEHLIRPKEL